jgi:ABC-type polysaccharide/polyol phosphate transport system ATPase subunit
MSSSGEISANHVWKRFRSDFKGSRLRDEVERLQRRIKGEQSEGFRWVLRDIDVHVGPGESVALVGANGSGKSTLLKILTRVMFPYAGSVDVKGRVGAMIEVRSGIHPELTGRENVFLYGRLLGLSKSQVTERFDEIVDFAELDSAIDRQVKRYSSGMQMRLGFAVAAYLEPDVLLVDEVLAVGDAKFQQRCMDRMRKVLQSGTTLVFVSHDLAAVEAMCKRAVWLDQGIVREEGSVRTVLAGYRQMVEHEAEITGFDDGPCRVASITATGPDDGVVRSEEDLDVRLVIEAQEHHRGSLYLGFSEGTAQSIFILQQDVELEPGHTEIRATLRHLPLPKGRFFLFVGLYEDSEPLVEWHPAAHIDVEGADLDVAPRAIVRLAPVHVGASWETAPTHVA